MAYYIYKENYSQLPKESFFLHPELIFEIDEDIFNNNNIWSSSVLRHHLQKSGFKKLPNQNAIESSLIRFYKSDFNSETKESTLSSRHVIVLPKVIELTAVSILTGTIQIGHSRYFLVPINISGSALPTQYINLLLYKPYLQADSDENIWNPTQCSVKTFSKDYLKEQIRARYGFFERPTNGLSNVVLDSFIPGLLYKYNMDIETLKREETFPKTSVCISPLLADLLEIKQVPIDQLIKILGYTIADIKELMIAVKRRSLDFIFAGVGGTGMNAAYWLDELSKITNTINLFNSITVYEKEMVEFSNILRFPLPLSTYYKNSFTYKVNLVLPYLQRLSNRKIQINNFYLTKNKTYSEFFSNQQANPNTVIYGAPGLEYRNELSSIGNFICATHASNSCSIWLNPSQTESIEVESYGMIQLGGFFMNQLRMTIGLLELLASDISLESTDTEFLNYTFDGTSQLKSDRVYNFQLRQDLLMMTEDQANNI